MLKVTAHILKLSNSLFGVQRKGLKPHTPKQPHTPTHTGQKPRHKHKSLSRRNTQIISDAVSRVHFLYDTVNLKKVFKAHFERAKRKEIKNSDAG